jgi:alpha-tubulin suppressor-like RCC1 family protein
VKYFRDKGLKVVDVALGNTHAIAVASDGNVYTWGGA